MRWSRIIGLLFVYLKKEDARLRKHRVQKTKLNPFLAVTTYQHKREATQWRYVKQTFWFCNSSHRQLR